MESVKPCPATDGPRMPSVMPTVARVTFCLLAALTTYAPHVEPIAGPAASLVSTELQGKYSFYLF